MGGKRIRTSSLSNKNNSELHDRELPIELWREIFLYLTAEDLNNCKYVSKPWYAVVSNPDFVDIHLKLTKQQSEEQILITAIVKPIDNLSPRYQYDLYSITNNGMLMRQKQLQLRNNLCLQARGSCDGLLLLQDKYDPSKLYISNPATSLFKPLPTPTHISSYWGLVHDAVIDKYKVFGIASPKRFIVLTLGVGETTPTPPSLNPWKTCPADKVKDIHCFDILSSFILFQNELLWLTTDCIDVENACESDQLCYCIHSINIETNKFSKIKIPLHIWNLRMKDLYPLMQCNCLNLLAEVKGSLFITAISKFKLEMFVLQDRLSSVWTKTNEISLQSLSNRPTTLKNFWVDDICFFPLRGVDPSNLADFVSIVIHHEDQLLLYDLKKQECKEIGFLPNGQKLCRQYLLHYDSLVSVKTDTPQLPTRLGMD